MLLLGMQHSAITNSVDMATNISSNLSASAFFTLLSTIGEMKFHPCQ